ncbi:hypothetical protein ACXYRP_00925 [Mycoplasma sp. 5912]
MSKYKKWWFSAVILASTSVVVAVACNGENSTQKSDGFDKSTPNKDKNPNKGSTSPVINPKEQSKPPTSTNPSETNPIKNTPQQSNPTKPTNNPEDGKLSEDKKKEKSPEKTDQFGENNNQQKQEDTKPIDKWAKDNANNLFKLVSVDNLKELISKNEKLFYNYETRKLVKQPVETKYLKVKELGSDSIFDVFSLKTDSEYQPANANEPTTNNGTKTFINGQIYYVIKGNVIAFSYKIAQYIPKQEPIISNDIYWSSFNIENGQQVDTPDSLKQEQINKSEQLQTISEPFKVYSDNADEFMNMLDDLTSDNKQLPDLVYSDGSFSFDKHNEDLGDYITFNKDDYAKYIIGSDASKPTHFKMNWDTDTEKITITYKNKNNPDKIETQVINLDSDDENNPVDNSKQQTPNKQKDNKNPEQTSGVFVLNVKEFNKIAEKYDKSQGSKYKHKLYLYKGNFLGFFGQSNESSNQILNFNKGFDQTNIAGDQNDSKYFATSLDKDKKTFTVTYFNKRTNQEESQTFTLTTDSKDDYSDNSQRNLNTSSTKLDKNQTVFVRPPFGVKFEIKNNTQMPPIITVFDHLDSPGAKLKNSSKYSESFVKTTSELYKSRFNNLVVKKNGAQEFSEFVAIPQLLNYYKNLDSNNESLVIFGGDTNIDSSNFKVDKYFSSDVHRVLVSDSPKNPDWYTSLNTKSGYANPYDKMYYLNGEDSYYDTITTSDDANLKFKVDTYKAFKEYIKNTNQYAGYDKDKNFNWNIRYRISDHAPVFTDVKVKNITVNTAKSTDSNYPKPANTIRIAHWNIENYGKKTTDYKSTADFKIDAIATLIKKVGFDVIGLTEINDKQGNSVNYILDELNKNGGNYKLILQPREQTLWQDTKYAFFQGGATEQIAIIYNANVLQPTNFTKTNQNSASFRESINLYGEVIPKN